MIKAIDPEIAHACGYNLGKVEERDRIRKQVEKLRDEAKGYLKHTDNPTDHIENGVLSARIHAFQQALDLLDGESDGK